MSNILLSKEEQDIVAFKFMKALPYGARMGICFTMLLIGFLIQAFYMEYYIPGCVFLFVGNLFLLVDGYDNRVKFGKFDPGSNWEKVDRGKFTELIKMQKEMQKWDRSTTDCSNPIGCWLMFMLIVICAGFIVLGIKMHIKPAFIIGIDAAILLLPHWVTGLRRISLVVDTALSKKLDVIEEVISDCRELLEEHEIEYFMLLSGDKAKIPKDVKFKVDLQGRHPDFLGLYGQVVMNNVQGNLFPYFYTVLVAKKGYVLEIRKETKEPVKKKGFLAKFLQLPAASSITQELKHQKDVEVLVIRQTTTKQSGYHTDRSAAHNIFLTGIRSAEINAYRE